MILPSWTVPHIRDHPREYGENRKLSRRPVRMPGPSPRIRGEYTPAFVRHFLAGTIPANTGRIGFTGGAGGATGDHPREYGENVLYEAVHIPGDGPSPRIRGESTDNPTTLKKYRTIPANTGRIRGRQRSGEGSQDHPREYGENQTP